MEAEEIKALASFAQVHDPGLGLLELEAHLGQDGRERRKGVLGLALAVTQHDQVIREADQHPFPARRPLPVEPVQIDVGKDGRNDCSHAKGNLARWGLWGWGSSGGW